jgi:nucleoside-diphosphate-sugar epimerase
VHCAAVITGTPEEMLRVNVEGARLLAETAMQEGCEHFLYLATIAVYALEGRPTSTWSVLLARRMIKGNFVLSGDGSASFPYVHVDNLVDAVIKAVHTAEAIGQAYNIVDGQTTARAYTDRFRDWLGLKPLPTRQEVVPWRGRFSGAKAERELGYVTHVSYEATMSEAERYLAERGMIKR